MENEEDITLELPAGEAEASQDDEPAYITDLKRQLDAERSARINAERQVHEAAVVVHRSRSEVDETNFQLVVNAIDTVNRDIELLSQAHTYALQNSDFDRATKIQREMSSHEAKLLQLNNGRQAMESAPREPEPQLPPADPVEAFASQLSPRSADWVRRHPEYVRDARLNSKMMAAHNLAVADGIPTDSDDYFSAIEDTLKIGSRNVQSDTNDQYAAKVVQRRDAAPAAAPSNRGDQSRSSNVVRLSAAEREMAEMMGMKPEDYAKNKVALKKEGKIQ
jgi:phage I-like protein